MPVPAADDVVTPAQLRTLFPELGAAFLGHCEANALTLQGATELAAAILEARYAEIEAAAAAFQSVSAGSATLPALPAALDQSADAGAAAFLAEVSTRVSGGANRTQAILGAAELGALHGSLRSYRKASPFAIHKPGDQHR